MRPVSTLLALALIAAPVAAGAQERAPEDDLVSTDPLSDDPIGIDGESDVSRVPGPPAPDAPETPEQIASRGPRPPTVRAQSGEVLTAINAVRETHHAVSVTLDAGLADVVAEMTFSSRARHPAEVGYRLAVPPGAALASLEVCALDRCREGLAVGESGRAAFDAAVRARGAEAAAPIAWAAPIEDTRGSAITLRAAPVPPRGSLIVRVRYVARAPIVGGIARMSIPGRGQDPRAASTTVRVVSPTMIGIAVDETSSTAPLVREAWYPIPISARVPTGAALAGRIERFRCGDARCARATLSAGSLRGRPVDLVLAIDASPSTEGPARGRIAPTVAAILSATPSRSRVWALAFGAEAETLVEEPRDPSDIPLVPLARAANRELGSATRVEVAWQIAERLLSRREGARDTHLVIVGDGGITRGPEAEAAFAAARRANVRISVVDVADRATWPALAEGVRRTRGAIVEAGREADVAVRGRRPAELESRVARIFAPAVAPRVSLQIGDRQVPLGALVAGEQLVWEGVVPRRGRVAFRGARAAMTRTDGARALALGALASGVGVALAAVEVGDTRAAATADDAACIDERGPARRISGVSSDAAPVALAEARSCAPSAPAAASESTTTARRAGSGVPRETVLRMLRQRVLPVARRCFRRDRRGRLDYASRAEFVVRLEDRELTEARVDGQIDDALRTCLLTAAHDLDIPRFSGAVIVRYPLFTARVPRPPTIELVPEVAREVDAVIPPASGTF